MPADDVPALLDALRAALDGTGPAVLPYAPPGGAGVSIQAAPESTAGTAPESTAGTAPEPAAGAAAPPVDSPAQPANGDRAAGDTVPPSVALVIETSGSTGTPKRVALSADALLASAAASDAAIAPSLRPGAGAGAGGPSKQWLLCLPAHYVAGANVLVRSIAAGTEPVLMPEGHFDPAAFRDAARAMTGQERYVSLVPVQLARLLSAAAADPALLEELRRFDAILVGGQALRQELRQEASDLGLRVVRTYGSSETSGGCVYDGVPIGPTRARVAGGVLELSGPTLAEGYLGDPERTDAAFVVAEGRRWYRTGDLGEVREDGTVVVHGRADNVIISGGEKVLLDAVERHVRSLPGLADAVVVAADSAEWGQVPVVVTTATDASLAAIRSSSARAIGRAAQPARLITVPEIPHLASGKPDRVALAALVAGPGVE